MVKRLTFRYTFAVDALQLIHTRAEGLILAFAGLHSQAFDHGVSRLSKKLVSSLESLLTYTTKMMEYLRTEMAIEKESLFTLDVLNRCEDLCWGCNALLDMLEEARDADLGKADRSLIEDYLYCTNQIAGKMYDLSQMLTAARESQASRTIEFPSSLRQARVRSRSPPATSRTSSTASIRVQMSSDLKPSLRRKKSVTWDPALDEVQGSQSGPSVKTSGRCAPPIPELSSYHDHIPDETSEPEEHSLDATRTLNAIEIEYRKIRPSCLELLNALSNPINFYILEKEHLWLAEQLVTNVLQELDKVELGKWDERNRRARKALATEVNELLKQMDEFLTEQQSSPVQDLSQDIRPQDLIPIQQQEKPEPLPIPRSDKAGASSSRNARPSPDPCLGHRIASLTRKELLMGGVKGMYITHEKYDGARYVLPEAIENFYIEVPPGSRPGDFVKAKLFKPKNNFEDSIYFAVKLALDDEACWPDTNEGSHRGSENQPSYDRDDRVPQSQTRHQSGHNKYHSDSAEEELVPHHRHSPVKSILKTTQTTQTNKSKCRYVTRKKRYDRPRSWDDYAHVADHDHMRRVRGDGSSSSDENTSSDDSSRGSRGSQGSRASGGSRASQGSRGSRDSSSDESSRPSSGWVFPRFTRFPRLI